MHKSLRRILLIAGVLLVLALIYNFLLPFGIIPKLASPNCGPEYWRWLGGSFKSKQAVVAYIQEHELELLSGSHTPRLGGFPADWVVTRMDVVIDWQKIAEDIQVENRPGYTLFTLTYHYPGCSSNQTYTFKVTSYGLASLYGCCGI